MLKAVFVISCLLGFTAANTAAMEPDTSSGYIGSGKCSMCHAEQYAAWETSKHAGISNEDASGSQSRPDSDRAWVKNCAGCHVTNMNIQESTWTEKGVGCEACHGPGEEHLSSGGDRGKIVSENAADICGRCHSRNTAGTGLMEDGTAWIVGYRPGMKLSSVPGLQMPTIDPDALPPVPADNHPFTYNMWEVSGHNNPSKQTFTIGEKEWSGPITCTACHNPHQSSNRHQLVATPDALCSSCHPQNAVLKGVGAKGVEQTRSLHTAISCIECHMTEKNHLMRIIRPDNPDLSAERTDTCSSCHEVKDRDIRAHQLQDWEAWYRDTLKPVAEDMLAIEETLKNNPALLNKELRQKFEDTKSNLSIIEEDGSDGAHNLYYALEIMSLAKRDLSKIKAAIE